MIYIETLDKRLVTSSLICFLISLFLPAIYAFIPSFGKIVSYPGWYALFFGSLSITMNLKQALIWLANPIYLLALLTMKRNQKFVIFFSTLALFSAIYFLTFDNIQYTWSGRIANITSFSIGYWLWTSSFALLILAAIINLRSQKNN